MNPIDIKMLVGAQEELLKTHEQVCKNTEGGCITHIVIKERINLLKKILSPTSSL